MCDQWEAIWQGQQQIQQDNDHDNAKTTDTLDQKCPDVVSPSVLR
jgi:hypothetical protein